MKGTLSKLIESSYVDSVSKSIKNKLAWKVNPYSFIQGDFKHQRKKRLKNIDYDNGTLKVTVLQIDTKLFTTGKISAIM